MVSSVGGPQGSYPVGGSNTFNNAAYTQLVDAAWEAISIYQQHNDVPPSDLLTQTVMATINQLYQYLSSCSPPPPSSNNAAAILTYLKGNTAIDGQTLGSLCSASQGGTTWWNNVTLVGRDYRDSGEGVAGLQQLLDQVPSAGDQTNSGDTAIQTDFQNLNKYMQAYNEFCLGPNPYGQEGGTILNEIATTINQLTNDLQNPPKGSITDGYLVAVSLFLTTPIQQGSQDTLASIASQVTKEAIPTDWNQDPTYMEFNNLLGALGEQNSSHGGDLWNLVYFANNEEWPNS
jgi:hypothetical protein